MNCTKPPRSRMLLASLLMVQQVTFGLPSLGLGAAEAKSYVGPKPKVWAQVVGRAWSPRGVTMAGPQP